MKNMQKIINRVCFVVIAITVIFIIHVNINKEKREFSVFDNIFEVIKSNNDNKNNENNNDNEKLKDNVNLVRTVDGDTAVFLVNGKEEKVRFLAIDTPETVKENTKVEDYGIEASNYTKKLLNSASEIKLEYEKLNDYDKYDRLLAWVFVDGKLLQEELIKKGFAKVAYIYDDYKYTDLLFEAQNIAKKNNVGIWSK